MINIINVFFSINDYTKMKQITIHELTNSITFLNFKTSLVIAPLPPFPLPPCFTDLWRYYKYSCIIQFFEKCRKHAVNFGNQTGNCGAHIQHTAVCPLVWQIYEDVINILVQFSSLKSFAEASTQRHLLVSFFVSSMRLKGYLAKITQIKCTEVFLRKVFFRKVILS